MESFAVKRHHHETRLGREIERHTFLLAWILLGVVAMVVILAVEILR